MRLKSRPKSGIGARFTIPARPSTRSGRTHRGGSSAYGAATVAETIADFQATGWAVLVAPLGTPDGIIDKVSEDLRKVAGEPELEKKLASLGSYTNPMSAAEAMAFVHKQQQTWQPVLDEIAKQQR